MARTESPLFTLVSGLKLPNEQRASLQPGKVAQASQHSDSGRRDTPEVTKHPDQSFAGVRQALQEDQALALLGEGMMRRDLTHRASIDEETCARRRTAVHHPKA
jgi:hypothetical protein